MILKTLHQKCLVYSELAKPVDDYQLPCGDSMIGISNLKMKELHEEGEFKSGKIKNQRICFGII